MQANAPLCECPQIRRSQSCQIRKSTNLEFRRRPQFRNPLRRRSSRITCQRDLLGTTRTNAPGWWTVWRKSFWKSLWQCHEEDLLCPLSVGWGMFSINTTRFRGPTSSTADNRCLSRDLGVLPWVSVGVFVARTRPNVLCPQGTLLHPVAFLRVRCRRPSLIYTSCPGWLLRSDFGAWMFHEKSRMRQKTWK